MRRVLIVQRRLTHYRVPLFEKMRDKLNSLEIQLDVLYGQSRTEELKKNDLGKLAWGTNIPTYYFFDEKVCWQPIHRYAKDYDLVIVTQENSLLANHLLLINPTVEKLAFWGHGGNLQSSKPNGFRERYKEWTSRKVDWWFAYTQLSADLVSRTGFPESKITILNNAIDTSELIAFKESVEQYELESLRKEMGLQDSKVGLFLGSLHKNKRLEFMLEAAEKIYSSDPSFRLLVIGDGPERETVKSWERSRDWIRWCGPLFGRDKIRHALLADIIVNPGLVGLGILDSFVCGVPMITTACGLHSPEISYLQDGYNGAIAEDSVGAFVERSLELLEDDEALGNLAEGCIESARHYTIEGMAERFVSGIESALSL